MSDLSNQLDAMSIRLRYGFEDIDDAAEFAMGNYTVVCAASERLEQLEIENARLRGAQRWVPVSERLPNSYERCEMSVYYDEDAHTLMHGFIENGIWRTPARYGSHAVTGVRYWRYTYPPTEPTESEG